MKIAAFYLSKIMERGRIGLVCLVMSALLAYPRVGMAVKDIPGIAEFHYQNGYKFMQLMKYRHALIELKQAIRIDGTVSKYYGAVGDIMKSLGKPQEAVVYYQKAIGLEPDNQGLRERLQGIKFQGEKASLAPFHQENDGKDSMVRQGDFFIDRTEVSIRQFQEVFPEYRGPEGSSSVMPTVNVSYAQAADYAAKIDSRLCTSDEWLAALRTYGDEKIADNNLFKDYFSGPYEVISGPGEVKNLLGNVAEWVGDNPNRPGYIGGHWFSAIMLQATPKKVTMITDGEGGSAKPYVGFRCCRDVQ